MVDMRVRNGRERGRSTSGWLVSRRALSFGDYDDPDFRRYRKLRVLNDDVIAAGEGFEAHGHEDVEIVSYIVRGQLEHGDDTGTGGVLEAGDVQRITAGEGIVHEEKNASDLDSVRLVQMWFDVDEAGLEPSYEQTSFPRAFRRNCWTLLVSPSGRAGSVSVRSDVQISGGLFGAGHRSHLELESGRGLWIYVVSGEAQVDGRPAAQGDSILVEGPARFPVLAETQTELIAIDMS